VRDALGIKSPSLEFAYIGHDAVRGLAVGIEQMTPLALAAGDALAVALVGTLAGTLAGALEREIPDAVGRGIQAVDPSQIQNLVNAIDWGRAGIQIGETLSQAIEENIQINISLPTFGTGAGAADDWAAVFQRQMAVRYQIESISQALRDMGTIGAEQILGISDYLSTTFGPEMAGRIRVFLETARANLTEAFRTGRITAEEMDQAIQQVIGQIMNMASQSTNAFGAMTAGAMQAGAAIRGISRTSEIHLGGVMMPDGTWRPGSRPRGDGRTKPSGGGGSKPGRSIVEGDMGFPKPELDLGASRMLSDGAGGGATSGGNLKEIFKAAIIEAYQQMGIDGPSPITLNSTSVIAEQADPIAMIKQHAKLGAF
jgi:hypothetical protein